MSNIPGLFGKSKSSQGECVSCDFVEHLKNLPYMNGNQYVSKLSGVKLLFVAPSDKVISGVLNMFCVPCKQYDREYSKDELISKEYHCGDAKVLVTNKEMQNWSSKDMEEASIRISGKTSWYDIYCKYCTFSINS